MKLISLETLIEMKNKSPRDFQSEFPKLIKKLIISSVNPDINLNIPSESEIETKGFDGIVEGVNIKDCFVPEGSSIWEIGTNKDYKKKIDKDFEERNNDSEISDKKSYHYRAVIPYGIDIKKKTELEKKYRKKSNFKSFRIIDGNQIVDWLENNIQHSIWFLRLFNNTVTELHIRSIPEQWKHISLSTKPNLNYLYFINGNDGQSVELINKLVNEPNVSNSVSSRWYGSKFAFYFTVASIMNSKNTKLILDTIIVDDVVSLDMIESQCKNKIVLVNFNFRNASPYSLQNNTYIYFDALYFNDIDLKQKSIEDIKTNLKSLGFGNSQIDSLISAWGRNPMSILRQISTNINEKIPLWASEKDKTDLVPLAILGNANFDEKGVESLIKLLVNDKDSFIYKLNFWSEFPDPPVRKNESNFRINSKYEYFEFVEVDSFLDIISKAKEFIIEYIKGKNEMPEHLIKSVIESFIILSCKNKHNEIYFNSFATQIFELVFSDKQYLDAFGSNLILLVDLYPNSLIYVLEKDNNETRDKILIECFTASEKKYFEISTATHIISAIEMACSIEETSFDALRCLLRIYYKISDCDSVLDSLGKLLAPASSAFGLIPIKPVDKINCLLEYSKNEDLNKTKKIMEKIQNCRDYFTVYAPEFYVKHKQKECVVTYNDIWCSNDVITNWLLVNSENLDGLVEIFINNAHRTPIEKMTTQISSLKKHLSETKFDSNERMKIKSKLLKDRESILKFESWKSLKPYVKVYDDLVSCLDTGDLFEDSKYILYEDFFPLSNPCQYNGDVNNEDEKLRSQCKDHVVSKLIELNGIEFIYKIIDELPKDVFSLWNSLREYIGKLDNEKIVSKLVEKKYSCGLRCYLTYLDSSSISVLFTMFNKEDIFISNLPYTIETIKLIDGLDNEFLFWESVYCSRYDKILFDSSYSKFLKYDPFKLVDHYAYEEDPDLTKGLEILQAVRECKKKLKSHDSYSLRTMVNKLDNEYYDDKLSIAEFCVLNFMLDDLSDYPLGVKRYFWNHPEELGDLLVNLSKTGKSLEQHTVMSKIYFEAICTLGGGCYIPKDYLIKKKDEISSWCKTIIQTGYKEEKRIKYILRSAVINTLSACPFDPNSDLWPTIEIADIIEEIAHKDSDDSFSVSSNFYTGFSNRRGARNVTDGSPEFSSSEKFEIFANKYKVTHPHVAKALYFISEGYKNEGEMDKTRNLFEKY